MERQVRPASYVNQDGLRTTDELKVEQRAVQSSLNGLHRFLFAPTPTNGHEGPPGPLQGGSDASEVQIHQARLCDELTDALDALAQHIIRYAQRDVEGHIPAHQRQQAVIGDHNQRIDIPG